MRTSGATNNNRTQAKPRNWSKFSFSRKVKWRCSNPDPQVNYRDLVDKYRVKQKVANCFATPETYLFVDGSEEFDFSKLPPTYVMKATHGWDMSLLVTDNVVQGENRNRNDAGRRADAGYLAGVVESWLDPEREIWRLSGERQYKFVRRGVIFEEFLEPVDYELQLFLFHGKCRLAMVFYRGFDHSVMTCRLYHPLWRPLAPASPPGERLYERVAPDPPPPPKSLMKSLKQLCSTFDHVRADFYVSKGKYYFGEFTFTHNNGKPGLIGKYDQQLGEFWLP